MTEKEKMQQQMLYDANYDTELIRERQVAKDLCYQFNQLRPSDETNQQQILSQLLGKKSDNCCILAPFWCDYGYNIEVGKNFFANHNTVILDGAKVTFGDNVFIAPNCGFSSASAERTHLSGAVRFRVAFFRRTEALAPPMRNFNLPPTRHALAT